MNIMYQKPVYAQGFSFYVSVVDDSGYGFGRIVRFHQDDTYSIHLNADLACPASIDHLDGDIIIRNGVEYRRHAVRPLYMLQNWISNCKNQFNKDARDAAKAALENGYVDGYIYAGGFDSYDDAKNALEYVVENDFFRNIA